MTPKPTRVPFGQDPGKLLEGATTCPHCGGVARSSPHAELRYICDICGAPRIDLRDPRLLSGREKPHLTAAKTALRQRAIWRVAGVFGGIASAFGLDPSAIASKPTAELGSAAPRPLQGGLSTRRLDATLPGVMRPMSEALEDFLRRLDGGEGWNDPRSRPAS